MTSDLVNEHADLIEELHRNGGDVFSLTWHAGDPPEERARLLEHHQAVQEALQRRGHIVQATVVRDEPDTEHFAIRLAPEGT